MHVKNKIYCHWDLVRFVTEKNLQCDDGTFRTLSVTDGGIHAFMIFLERANSISDYEVKVYKVHPKDKYIPNANGKIKYYEENDEYISFFFINFELAIRFTANIGYTHPEYRERPIREISE